MARQKGMPAKPRRPADSEIAAMGKIIAAIEPLPWAARQRVLAWAKDRAADMPVIEVSPPPVAVPMPLFGGDEAASLSDGSDDGPAIAWPVKSAAAETSLERAADLSIEF